MKTMTAFLSALMLSPLLAAGAPAPTEHSANAHRAAAATAAAPYVEGEVKRVDKAAGTIALKHGAIANLEMPAMSMTFRAADRAMLERVKEGDKVRFKADNVRGALTLTELQRVN